jgi:hypothetical protein
MPQTFNNWKLNTPIAFFIFNRPETTARVFETIQQAKPPVLLIVADGPRSDRPGEAEKCAAARAIVEHIDWDCDVYKNYAESNLGCKQRVSSGLDWVFEKVERAIILEDDCLPHPTFFRFCEELLARYRDDTRIMAIAGNNLHPDQSICTTSYYFSRYNHIWGWATWRRAWNHYDVEMKGWPTAKQENFLRNWFNSRRSIQFWTRQFDAAYTNQIDTWDFAWTFACWCQNSLSIIPSTNLISNIGFSPDATHTKETSSSLANRATKSMEYPLQHPNMIMRNFEFDNLTESTIFIPSFKLKFIKKVKRFLSL